MKIPLLLHAPSSIGTGPVVMLAKGRYQIESNLVDTVARLALNSDLLPFNNEYSFELIEDTRAQISINKSGKESQLTIYANKL